MQVAWFPGWVDVLRLQQNAEERAIPIGLSVTEACIYTAGRLANAVVELPPKQVAGHRPRTLQALQSWDANGSLDFATKVRQTAGLKGDGANSSADADAADSARDAGNASANNGHIEGASQLNFWNGTLGCGVPLALELGKLIDRMMEPSSGHVRSEDTCNVVLSRLIRYSARETCRTLNLDQSDGLPVRAIRTAAATVLT